MMGLFDKVLHKGDIVYVDGKKARVRGEQDLQVLVSYADGEPVESVFRGRVKTEKPKERGLSLSGKS